MHRFARMAIAIALAALLVALMATALVQEAPHEWLGMATFIAFAAHMIHNRRWWTHLARGKWTAARVAVTVLDVALACCMLGQIASSLVLSEHALAWLPAIPGASWARTVHLLCSYWGFALAFIHAGLHVRQMSGSALASKGIAWLSRLLCLALAAFGALSFAQLGLADYLLLRRQFVFADYSIPLWLSLARYFSMGIMFAAASHYIQACASWAGKKRRSKKGFAIPKGTVEHPSKKEI